MTADQAALLAELTQTRTVHFWGEDYTITPVLIDAILGDGGKIISLYPLNTRPNHYILRIDSSWGLDHDDPDPLIDHMDEVYEAIEDEYGNARWCGDACPQDCDGGHDATQREWPALNDECGSTWNLIKPRKVEVAAPETEAVITQ